jgi:hypothetical protein
MFAEVPTPVIVTMSSLAVIIVGFIALFRMCKPFNGFKGFVYIFCAIVCAGAILFFPDMFKYVSLSYTDTLFLIVVCQFAYPLYVVLNKVFEATSNQDKKNLPTQQQ